jgi:hypothetical protein
VPVETGSAETEVVTEQVERCAVCEQMADGADVSVVGAVLDQ